MKKRKGRENDDMGVESKENKWNLIIVAMNVGEMWFESNTWLLGWCKYWPWEWWWPRTKVSS